MRIDIVLNKNTTDLFTKQTLKYACNTISGKNHEFQTGTIVPGIHTSGFYERCRKTYRIIKESIQIRAKPTA